MTQVFCRPPFFFLFLLCLLKNIFHSFQFQKVLRSAWCSVNRYCTTWIRCLPTGPQPIPCTQLQGPVRQSSRSPRLWQQKEQFLCSRIHSLYPSKPSTTLAINSDPMETDVTMFPSSEPPPTLLDIADSCTLTSSVSNQSVAFFIDSAADMEFAALLKVVDKLEALRVPIALKKNVCSVWKFNFKSIVKSWHIHNKI